MDFIQKLILQKKSVRHQRVRKVQQVHQRSGAKKQYSKTSEEQ